ncbi:MAG TPA: SDR family oxidoreductase [Candidatus Nanopelagicales bacterium]|nr:SDR family oxidoreductase [Candidatus Nanopelagicales bacterium]
MTDAPDLPAGLSLAGRTALVTGGGTGIGRACALLLAERGARVFVAGRTEETLRQTQDMATPGQVEVIVADVREPDQVDAALTRIVDEAPLDILVNNAGGQFIAPAEQIPTKGFRAVMRLNLDATWYLTTQAAARSMLPSGYGKVVCITMTPSRGMPGMSHSSASRAAVESLVRTWGAEWASRGVRAVAVAPGIVHTDAMERYGIDPAQVAAIVPAGRLQRPDEVAELVAFLAAPAGDYITGTTLVADGGLNVSAPSPLA